MDARSLGPIYTSFLALRKLLRCCICQMPMATRMRSVEWTTVALTDWCSSWSARSASLDTVLGENGEGAWLGLNPTLLLQELEDSLPGSYTFPVSTGAAKPLTLQYSCLCWICSVYPTCCTSCRMHKCFRSACCWPQIPHNHWCVHPTACPSEWPGTGEPRMGVRGA